MHTLKRLTGLTTTTVLLSLTFALAPASATSSIDYGFDGCSWRLEGGALHAGGGAVTRTHDLNGGCSLIDADLKYTIGGGQVYTKFCPTINSHTNTCQNSNAHHQSRGAAKSYETDQWQHSGWQL